MGQLLVKLRRGKEVLSFTYDQDGLRCGHAQFLDPDLQLERVSNSEYPQGDPNG